MHTFIILAEFCIIIYFLLEKYRMKNEIGEIKELLKDVVKGNMDRRIIVKQQSVLAEVCFMMNEIIEMNKQILVSRDAVERENNQLMTSLSHDIRTPLTSIIGYLDALSYQYVNQELSKDFIEITRKKAYLLKGYIDNLFQWFKLNSGEQIFIPQDMDIVETVKIILANWIVVFEKNNIQYDFFTEIENLVLCIDHNILERILNNLIQNVVEHSGASCINVIIKNDNVKCYIIIEDNGIGIAEKEQERIFERLYKCDEARENKGSGLGLAIVKKLIDLMEGQIYMESSIGKGSKFILELNKT